MHPTVNIAVRAARAAGDVILRYHNQVDILTIENKSINDFVSEVDKTAEKAIINEIKKAFPKHSILAEESGKTLGDDDFLWIIDPLDGTTNYLHGFPQYAVSIALLEKGVTTHAVIYDPFKEELFTASKGEGAYLNNERIRVTISNGLEETLIGTGFPFKHPQHLDCYLDTFKAILPHVSDIRRAGAAALDLAYVASGRFDGYFHNKINIWDIAAGVLIVNEAGGKVNDINKFDINNIDIRASNNNIHNKMLENLKNF